MTHYNNCPVCNSPEPVLFLKCKDFLVTGKEYELYQCSDCSFIFTQDHPDSNEIGAYYVSDDYISHSDSQKGLINSLYHFARKLMLNKKSGIVKKVCGLKTGSILDIGSGTGYFPYKMKKAGWEVTGVEINEAARNYSIKKFGLNVIKPEAIKNLPDESFDCITLWHVLEHLENPEYYLEEIHRLLKPDGSCIIALPNNLSSDAKHYKQFWAAFDVPRHLWHFSPDNLYRFANSHKFNTIGKIPLPLDAFYISILSENNKGSHSPLISGLLHGLRSFMISTFRPERNSSLVYILEKL